MIVKDLMMARILRTVECPIQVRMEVWAYCHEKALVIGARKLVRDILATSRF